MKGTKISSALLNQLLLCSCTAEREAYRTLQHPRLAIRYNWWSQHYVQHYVQHSKMHGMRATVVQYPSSCSDCTSVNTGDSPCSMCVTVCPRRRTDRGLITIAKQTCTPLLRLRRRRGLTSSLLTGEMMADEANCAMTSSTGSTRYLLASPQPIGGAPFTSGINHAVPAPDPHSSSLSARRSHCDLTRMDSWR